MQQAELEALVTKAASDAAAVAEANEVALGARLSEQKGVSVPAHTAPCLVQ